MPVNNAERRVTPTKTVTGVVIKKKVYSLLHYVFYINCINGHDRDERSAKSILIKKQMCHPRLGSPVVAPTLRAGRASNALLVRYPQRQNVQAPI
jgi:hypothetical protein